MAEEGGVAEEGELMERPAEEEFEEREKAEAGTKSA